MLSKVQDVAKALKKLAVGSELPDIALRTPEGKIVRLQEQRGQYVLVEFWASWCAPCRRGNPELVDTYQRYKAKGFQIYAISLDTERLAWESTIAQDRLPWLHVTDLKGWESPVVKRFGITSIPANILLDKQGRVLATNLRGEQLNQKLAGLLGQQ